MQHTVKGAARVICLEKLQSLPGQEAVAVRYGCLTGTQLAYLDGVHKDLVDDLVIYQIQEGPSQLDSWTSETSQTSLYQNGVLQHH